MNTIIFAGPTLPPDERTQWTNFTWRGPAAQGDVYRAILAGATTIGIIDGYFETVPSVWHKEILWAMSRGVPVFGASSMGALRAAELSHFGMVGVGEIFQSFADGTLEDDDEVAIVHGPAEDGYRSLSEAMVNIRATLRAAEREGVITPSLHLCLVDIAKNTFYQERSLPRLVRDGAQLGDLDALRGWLPTGRVDQKRRDAVAMLQQIEAKTDDTATPPGFVFEHSDAWEAMRRAIRADNPA